MVISPAHDSDDVMSDAVLCFVLCSMLNFLMLVGKVCLLC